MKDYGKKGNHANKQPVHEDKTGYAELNHKKSDARSSGMSYDDLMKKVKKL